MGETGKRLIAAAREMQQMVEPPKPQRDMDRELVKAIAMDIGKSAVSKIRTMYPDVYAAMNSGCRLTLRNHIYNEIMAALDTTDADQIEARLKQRAEDRKHLHSVYDRIRAQGE